MMSFMSKKKKFKFHVRLELDELDSVPFVTGVLFCKVRLHDGGSYTDFSPREEVLNNCVRWGAEFNFPCKMTASANTGVLDPCVCRISVRKEMKGGRSHQKLGFVDLNLAHFAGAGRQTRRYLLEGYDAKHRQDNSNLKISVELSLIAGDPVFKVPSSFSISQQNDPMAPGLVPEGSDRGLNADDRSESSLASNSSSGFSSLTRKGRLECQAPDNLLMEVDTGDRDATLSYHCQHTCTNAVVDMEAVADNDCMFGHSRNASYTSQQSRGSGYASLSHSRQSSVSNDTSSHNRTPSLGSTLERRRKLEESGKESLGATRVDAEALVQQLIESTDLGTNDSDETSGLQLLVQKDGTMALR